ncbi:MAG: NADPH-dependent oxidoreductase, partial [Bacteroides sp.]|nr:NADPH-dependent oxidoreductase [Bacteroides sp.]
YPTNIPLPTDRLPVEAIIHQETYRKDSDERVKEFFQYKEQLPENSDFVKENNKQSLAQVFTDVRYPDKTNKLVSETFKALIEEKGFRI